MRRSSLIESILFYKAEPMSLKELSRILGLEIEQVKEAVIELKNELTGRGIVLLEKDDEIMLRTSPEASQVITDMTKEELSRDIGRAGLETLSIILYKAPISRRDVEYIRGVKSSFVLRSLMMRGLIEKITDQNDSRVHLYRPTFDLLAHLGISNASELPDIEQVKKELEDFIHEPLAEQTND